MGQFSGLFEAVSLADSNGATPEFRYSVRDGTYGSDGVPALEATLAVGGTLDGADLQLQAFLAGAWHDVPGGDLDASNTIRVLRDGAPRASRYRFVIASAGASTSVSVEIASSVSLEFVEG